MKIFFIASEVYPLAKTGGMADVCGALPLALEKLGCDVAIIMPLYKTVRLKYPNLRILNDQVSVLTLGKNITVYLIKHAHYFNREGLYGDQFGDYADNLLRFQFFAQQALKIVQESGVKKVVVHAHDWQAALVPVYLKAWQTKIKSFQKIKSVLTIHNLAYQGIFSKDLFPKLLLEPSFFTQKTLEFYDQINLLKGGIIFADEVSTVSPRYSYEITTKEFGCGLEGVLKERSKIILGIINGIDQQLWNPSTDPVIEKVYGVNHLEKKDENKKYLLAQLNCSWNSSQAVFGFVHRLSHQKGLDLIGQSLESLIRLSVQIIFIGVGEEKYHLLLKSFEKKYPKNIKVILDFNDEMARRVYAGSDFFLMPSVFEPCGLSQMISLRYASIPIVAPTGGLVDTVSPFNSQLKQGNGFVMKDYSTTALIKAVEDALALYQDKVLFDACRRNALNTDFSWEKSAQQYQRLYTSLF